MSRHPLPALFAAAVLLGGCNLATPKKHQASCTTTSQCATGQVCVSGICAVPPASCSDGVKDGNETDVDCGGSCTPCGDGSACGTSADCQSQVCTDAICQAPSCSDGVQNGNETGVDCGGVCGPCVPPTVAGAPNVPFPYGLAMRFTGAGMGGHDFSLELTGCGSSDGDLYLPSAGQASHLGSDGSLDLTRVGARSDLFQSTPATCAGGLTLPTTFQGTGGLGWYVLYQPTTSLKSGSSYTVSIGYRFVGADGTPYPAHTKTVTVVVPQYAPYVEVATASGATQQVAGDAIGGLGVLTAGQLTPGKVIPGLTGNLSLAPADYAGVYLLARTAPGHPASGDLGFLASYIDLWDNVPVKVTVSLSSATAPGGGPGPRGTFALSSDYALGGAVTVAADGQSVTFTAPANGADISNLVSSIYWLPAPTAPAFQAGDTFVFRYAAAETASSTRPCPVPVFTPYDASKPDACRRTSSVSFTAQVTTDATKAGKPIGS